MNKKEFLAIMGGLKSNYPNWKFEFTDKAVIDIWYESLKDIPYDIANIGVRKLLAEEEFYPNIAKIRKACASVTTAPATDSTEAWGLVQRAFRVYGQYRADEAMASFPQDVAQAVRHMGGFQSLCESQNAEADRAHFYRCIDQIANRREKESVLSLDLKQAIHSYQQIASTGEKQAIEDKAEYRPLLEESTQEIEYSETESVGDILRRQLRMAN